MPNILIIAGEVSGDVYGAHLAKELVTISPETRIFGIGGDELRAVSEVFLFETAYTHSVGIWGGLSSFFRKKTLLQTITQFAKIQPLDQVVIIDFQHLNFHLLDLFETLNIPVTTFITPNFWIWKDLAKAKKIAQKSTQIITIFEKEYDLYKDLHPRVYYFGHPMVDIVHSLPRTLTGHQLALLPGSRSQEIPMVLPKMLRTAALVQSVIPEVNLVIGVSSERFLTQIQTHLDAFPLLKVDLWVNQKEALFSTSSFLLCASGSVTLEAALYGVPMGVFCTLPPFTYWVAKYILRLKIDPVSLPNMIAGYHRIPEWTQGAIIPEKIAPLVIQELRSPSNWSEKYAPILTSMKSDTHPIKAAATQILN